MKNECLRDAPRDRRILVYNEIWHHCPRTMWKLVGHYWVEAWYGPHGWQLWCGAKNATTTESVNAQAWVEIPIEINT